MNRTPNPEDKMPSDSDVNAFLHGAAALLDKASAEPTRGRLLIMAANANTLIAAAFNAMSDRERAGYGRDAFGDLVFVDNWGTKEARARLDDMADNVLTLVTEREDASAAAA